MIREGEYRPAPKDAGKDWITLEYLRMFNVEISVGALPNLSALMGPLYGMARTTRPVRPSQRAWDWWRQHHEWGCSAHVSEYGSRLVVWVASNTAYECLLEWRNEIIQRGVYPLMTRADYLRYELVTP